MATKKHWFKKLKESAFALVAIAVATGLSFGLDALGVGPESILLVYLLPILAIAIVCHSIIYSIVASIVIVLLFNFCFTNPRYSFAMDDPGLYISLAVFFLVSTVLYIETRSTHKEIERRRENEKRLNVLGNFSAFLLEEREPKEIFDAMAKGLTDYFQIPPTILSAEEVPAFLESHPSEQNLGDAIRYCLKSNLPAGFGENQFSSSPNKVIPVGSEEKVFGLIILPLSSKKKLSREEESFLESFAASAANALARNAAIESSEKSRLAAENEKYKADLLRWLSHDIKTPLTALETGTSLLASSYKDLSDEDRFSIVKNLNDESVALSDYVENLLSLSKVNSLGDSIPKTWELAQDLIEEAVNGENSFLKNHQLKSAPPEEGLLVFCDGRLIVQVLRNLIHNALVHTKENSSVLVNCVKEKGGVQFLVRDNGGGIPKEKLNHLFEEYSTISETPSDRLRGHGLGLSICRSVIQAHKGWIKGYNNDQGGADFVFWLPDKKKGKARNG